MNSALIVDAVVLTAVLEADFGQHREIGTFRILRPLFIAAGIIPLFLKAVVTTGNGLSLEIAAASAGVILGLVATYLMTVYRSPTTNKAVSRTGFAYAGLWTMPARREASQHDDSVSKPRRCHRTPPQPPPRPRPRP